MWVSGFVILSLKTSMADIRCSQPENMLTPQDGLLDNDNTSSLTADVNATLSSLPIYECALWYHLGMAEDSLFVTVCSPLQLE